MSTRKCLKHTDDQMNSYIEDMECRVFTIELENDSEAFARAVEIRVMLPTNLRDV